MDVLLNNLQGSEKLLGGSRTPLFFFRLEVGGKSLGEYNNSLVRKKSNDAQINVIRRCCSKNVQMPQFQWVEYSFVYQDVPNADSYVASAARVRLKFYVDDVFSWEVVSVKGEVWHRYFCQRIFFVLGEPL